MSLKNIIDKEIKESMFNKNKMRLIALRAIKAAILLEEKSDSTSSLDENLLLMNLIKQRKDSLIFYKDQNRSDLADKENSEINILSEFLPEQITNEKLIEGILKIIENANASSMKDMGKVMGIATKKYKGQADNSRIAQIIKEKLN